MNVDLVDWALRLEDVEDLPSGAVLFDLKSRGYRTNQLRVDDRPT